MTRTVAKCLICFTSQLDSENKFESSQLLNHQLNVIFVLENIFELKPNQLQLYLRQWGNPGEWVNFCEKCELDICSIREIFLKLHDIKRKFEKAKWELQDKIRVQEEERTMTGAGKSMGIVEIFYSSRNTFLRRRVWKPTFLMQNPFKDGDQRARELALKIGVDEDKHEPVSTNSNGDGLNDQDEGNDFNLDSFHSEMYSSEDFNSSPDTDCDEVETANMSRIGPLKSSPKPEVNQSRSPSIQRKRRALTDPTKRNRRRMYCPVCGSGWPTNSHFRSFCDHFEQCISSSLSSPATGTIFLLKCSLCRKWSCSSVNPEKFMEHIALCWTPDDGRIIPWRDSVVNCNLCEDSNSSYLPFPKFIKHVYDYHQHKYGCSQCPFRAANSTLISCIHWKRCHSDLNTPNSERFKMLPEGNMMPLPHIPWWCPAPECFQKFQDEASRDQHVKDCEAFPNPTLERSFKCSYCSQRYFSEEELQMHRAAVHGSYRSSAPKCEKCDLLFNNKKALHLHQRKVHKDNLFKCLKCGAEFHCNNNYNGHLRLEHGDKEDLKEYTCHTCLKVFGHKSQLRVHVASAHTSAKCVGDKEASAKIAKIRHKKKEHQRKLPIPIPVEGRTKFFISKYQKDSNGNFSCTWESCGKQYKSTAALRLHVKNSHEEQELQQHICDLCGKSFGKLTLLKTHIKYFHEKYLPFACDVCGKGCPQKRNLLNHKAAIHGIGFKCEVEGCSKVFPNVDQLGDHRKYKHEGVQEIKPFSCQFCGKGFYQERKVRQHEQAMHTNRDSKPFKCTLPSCEKRFSTQHYLNCHLRYTHKIERKK